MKNVIIGLALACSAVAMHGGKAAAYDRVMLVSIDGMHAIDLANYVAAHPRSTLAALSQHGVTYPNALTTNPSDSFPGFLAQLTGGSPKSTGVFYDDSFDRSYFPAGSDCKGAPGTEVSFTEDIDVDHKRLDAGGTPGDWRTRKRDRVTAYRFLVWLGIGVHLMSRWTPDESERREATRLAC